MASESEHITLANSNQLLIYHLIDDGRFPDWLVTVAFYKALHVVEAVFCFHLHAHSTSHTDRDERLKRYTRFGPIFKDYQHLFNESIIVRYLSGPPTYLTIEDVKSKLVYKRLLGVEQKSLAFLSDAARAKLVKVVPPSKTT